MKTKIIAFVSTLLPLVMSSPMTDGASRHLTLPSGLPNLVAQEFAAIRTGLIESLDSIQQELNVLNYRPLYLNEPKLHPIDLEDVLPARLSESIKFAKAYLGQLDALLEPHKKWMEGSMYHLIPAAMQVVTESGAIETLTRNPSSEGLGVETLADGKRKMDAQILTRLLRLLANEGYLSEVKEGYFAANRVTMALANPKKQGVLEFVKWQSKISLKSAAYISDHMFDPKTIGNTDAAWAPFAKAFPQDQVLWTYMANHPEDAANFFPGMSGFGSISAPAVLEDFDWTRFGKFVLVDVGAGNGAFAKPLVDKYPNNIVRVILQDNNDEALRMAKAQSWPKNLQIDFEKHDYLTPEPESIKALQHKVFLMRYIIHDLHDARALQTLRSIHDAMSATDRLIIIDYLVIPAVESNNHHSVREALNSIQDGQETGGGDVTFRGSEAVYPLPRSFGHASLLPSLVDVEMFSAINAHERTQEQWNTLLKEAGFKFSIHINRGKDAVFECWK